MEMAFPNDPSFVVVVVVIWTWQLMAIHSAINHGG
jgi:hypothetical protein